MVSSSTYGCVLFNLQMMAAVKTAIRPVGPAPEETNTSVQNARKVPSYFMFSKHQRPSLPRGRRCLLVLPLPGRFLTAQQTCVSKCPAGFFASGVTSACEACPPGCAQCADSRGCVRCQSARKAQLFLQDGRCVSECAG